MKLTELGERRIIDLAREILAGESSDELALLDDCAAVKFNDSYLLITTDMISRRTHIPEKATPYHVGWHLAAINLSDIAAMGGEPIGLVVALGLPASYDGEYVKGLMEGANSCVSKYGTSIIGGDTKEAESLTLSACAIGSVPEKEIMRRKGAKPGDMVCVTGELGKSASAYYSIEKDPGDLKAIGNLMEVQPRITEGRILARSHLVTSAMDISDGLASSLYQMGSLSEISFEIDLDLIPAATQAEEASEILGRPLEDLTCYFGGDYELIVTVKSDKVNALQEAMKATGTPLSEIGKVTENQKNILIKDGVSTFLDNRGYEHFRWNL